MRAIRPRAGLRSGGGPGAGPTPCGTAAAGTGSCGVSPGGGGASSAAGPAARSRPGGSGRRRTIARRQRLGRQLWLHRGRRVGADAEHRAVLLRRRRIPGGRSCAGSRLRHQRAVAGIPGPAAARTSARSGRRNLAGHVRAAHVDQRHQRERVVGGQARARSSASRARGPGSCPGVRRRSAVSAR